MKRSKGLRILQYALRYEDKIEGWAYYVAAGLVVVIVLIVVGQVLLRTAWFAPPGIYEAVELLMVGTVFLAITYAQKVEGHIKMDLVINKVSPKTRSVLETIYRFAALIMFAVIAVSSAGSALGAYQIGEVTMGLVELPRWPSKSVVFLGSLLLCLRFLRQIIQSLLLPQSSTQPTSVAKVSEHL